MKLFGALWSCLGFTVFVFILIATPTPSSALIEDALDVFHVVKEVTTAVLKAWDLVQTSPLGSNINFPLMREKQRKVLSRLKEVSKQITKTEDQHAEQIALAIQSVNNFIEGNLQLLSQRNDITDTMHRISSRFQQMQQYELHQDKLETSTLLTFAEWTVSPNPHSVHHLMDRLHLIMFGTEDKANKSGSNMLEMLALSYEIQSLRKDNVILPIFYKISRMVTETSNDIVLLLLIWEFPQFENKFKEIAKKLLQ